MANIIPLVLIGISLSAIVVIVVRKFSSLANLDVDTIPAEKEAKFKEQLVESRLNRGVTKTISRLTWIFREISGRIGKYFSWAGDKLNDMKKEYNSEAEHSLNEDEKMEKIESLFSSLEGMDERDDFSEMESILIKIIGLDGKNVPAFKALGELYYKSRKYEEAKQALEHVLKLVDDNETDQQAKIYYDLALVHKETQDTEKAFESIKKSVKFSSNNPRFLDAMLEISIMNKDKILASDTLDKLKQVNPDNKKLEEWGSRIEKME